MLGLPITPTSLLWALRQILQFGGIWLVMNGHASNDDIARALGIFDQVLQPTGAVMFMIGFAGNIIASFRNKVTIDGNAVGTGAIRETVGAPAAKDVVRTAKEAIAAKPTLWERLTGRNP